MEKIFTNKKNKDLEERLNDVHPGVRQGAALDFFSKEEKDDKNEDKNLHPGVKSSLKHNIMCIGSNAR